MDIGRVILDREAGNDGGYIDGALAALRRLVDERFGERVHLVSKCGAARQALILQIFEERGFYEQASIARERVHFCRERHQKAPICARLGITIFIDDRVEVLNHLTMVPQRIAFCPRPNEVMQHFREDMPYRAVRDWSQVITELLDGSTDR